MIRIYTKPKGQIPDYSSPVVLHNFAPSIESFCDRLHKGINAQFKYAWVWGSSVRHQPQKVFTINPLFYKIDDIVVLLIYCFIY